jgi:hypothetical protein
VKLALKGVSLQDFPTWIPGSVLTISALCSWEVNSFIFS